MASRKDFLSSMEEGKANAMRDRNRGLHVGKSAPGWHKKRSDYAPIARGSWDDVRQRASHGWKAIAETAIAQFCSSVYPANHGTLLSDDDMGFIESKGGL